MLAQKPLGHLAASGVASANEQDDWFFHGSFYFRLVSESPDGIIGVGSIPMKALELPIYDRELEQTRTRLSRIEGQVRGISRMLEEKESSVKVLQQLASVQAALRGVTKTVLHQCLERCAPGCGCVDELMDVIYKFAK